MIIEEYTSKNKIEWDKFISTSKNSHFMFYRDYMEYHADRFADASLMFYDKNKLVAVLVASVCDDIVYCHQGLTFGGFVMSKTIRTEQVLECFELFYNYYKENGYKKIIYKAIPYIYHRYPADEDLFAISRYNFNLIRCDISSAIDLRSRIPYTESRKSVLRKFHRNNVQIIESQEIHQFINLLTKVVDKHGVKPVHSGNEMQYLMECFPNNIKLIVAYIGDKMVAGTLLFLSEPVIHTQYMANSLLGQEAGALDGVIDYVIKKYGQDSNYHYLNFGISTYNGGVNLNSGLIFQKEGFGARGVVQNFYEIIF